MAELSQQELREQLSNMSPEELSAWQKKQCLFCHIISGNAPSKLVYEDKDCIALLDIHPATPGHILLIPKEHYTIMPHVPAELLQTLFSTAKKISHALLKAEQADGTTILVQNGPAAGQKAQHFMIHIIPRQDNDNVTLNLSPEDLSLEERNSQLQLLRQKLTPENKKAIGMDVRAGTSAAAQGDLSADAKVDDMVERVKLHESGADKAEKILEEVEEDFKKDNQRLEHKKETDLDKIARLFG